MKECIGYCHVHKFVGRRMRDAGFKEIKGVKYVEKEEVV